MYKSTTKLPAAPSAMLQVISFLAFVTLAAGHVHYCQREDCKELAATIRQNMDTSVSPCDDFYQYACGKFIKKHQSPSDAPFYSTRTIYEKEIEEKIYQLLEDPEHPDDSKAMIAAKRQFKQCRDLGDEDQSNLQFLLNEMRWNGDFPMIVPGEFQFTKSIQEVQDLYARKTGSGSLYTVYISPGVSGVEDYAAVIDEPKAYPHGEVNIFLPEHRDKFVTYIANVAEEFAAASGVSIPRKNLLLDAEDVVNFLQELSNLRDPDRWRKRGLNFTVADAEKKIKNGLDVEFDLLAGLNRIFQDVPDTKFMRNDFVFIRELEYMQGLMKLLKNTAPRTLLNVIQFQFLDNHLAVTTKKLRNLYLEQYGLNPRNVVKLCANAPNLQRALGRMFVKQYLPLGTLNKAKETYDEIKHQLSEAIRRTAYLDIESKENALKKLKNLETILGYEPSYATDAELDRIYEKYKMSNVLVESYLNYEELGYNTQLKMLRNPPTYEESRKLPVAYPTKTEATYVLTHNMIQIPAAMLLSPLLAPSFPASANHAGLGVMAATVMSLVYTFLGVYFDDQGEINTWISEKSLQEFKKQEECFINQYKSATIKELEDQGIHINMSDYASRAIFAEYHLGLATAYDAFKTKILNHDEDLLPNLDDFNLDKQFFLNYATHFCETVNPQKLLEVAETGKIPLVTGRLKVNFALSNLPQFSYAFGCRVNDPMNPEEKCRMFS